MNKNDIKQLTFYNLFITKCRVDATTYKHEKGFNDNISRVSKGSNFKVNFKKVKNFELESTK